jgi:hypothetical protein
MFERTCKVALNTLKVDVTNHVLVSTACRTAKEVLYTGKFCSVFYVKFP